MFTVACYENVVMMIWYPSTGARRARAATRRFRWWYRTYSTAKECHCRLFVRRSLLFTRVHSEDFSAASALALASANAFFFAVDTLGITEPGFFLPSGSSYFLSR